QERGRGEAGEVTDDAATERDQRRPTLDPRFEQPIPGGAQGRQALVLLPVVDLDDERIEAGRPQRVLNRPAVQRANALAGQQTAATCVPERRQSRPDAGEDGGPHQDGVRAIAQIDHHLGGRAVRHAAPRGGGSTRARTRRATSSGARPSVSTAWVASAYAGARAASRVSMRARRSLSDAVPSPFNSGRSLASPTRRRISAGVARRQITGPAAKSRLRFSGPSRAPPPPPMTASPRAHASSIAARSRLRNAASPSDAKIAATDRPALDSISASVSTNGRPRSRASRRPTSVFPVPMNPARMMCDAIIARLLACLGGAPPTARERSMAPCRRYRRCAA